MASIYKKKKSDSHYVIAYFNEVGKRIVYHAEISDKKAAKEIANKLEADVAKIKAGVIDATDRKILESRAIDIDEHKKGFIESIKAENRGAKYIKEVVRVLSKFIDHSKATSISDLSLEAANKFLVYLLDSKKSAKTRDAYAAIIKAFGLWLKQNGKWRDNVFDPLRAIKTEADTTRERMPITIEQLQALIHAAKVRGVDEYKKTHSNAREYEVGKIQRSGDNRSALYAFAAYTGLRRNECKQVMWADIDFTECIIKVRASTTKNAKAASIPLHPDIMDMLTAEKKAVARYYGKVPSATEKVFKVGREIIKRLKKDAKAAGIPLKDDLGRVLDFHALRVCTATLLFNSNVPAKVAQAILRHADIKLTLGLYTKLQGGETKSAVASLPSLKPTQAAEKSSLGS